jgi:hypothetical protein
MLEKLASNAQLAKKMIKLFQFYQHSKTPLNRDED